MRLLSTGESSSFARISMTHLLASISIRLMEVLSLSVETASSPMLMSYSITMLMNPMVRMRHVSHSHLRKSRSVSRSRDSMHMIWIMILLFSLSRSDRISRSFLSLQRSTIRSAHPSSSMDIRVSEERRRLVLLGVSQGMMSPSIR